MLSPVLRLGRWVVNLGREPRDAGYPPRLVMCGLTRDCWYWSAHRVAWRLYRIDLWRPPHRVFPFLVPRRIDDARD